jgi:carboxyl-terminal processing protease
MKLPHRLARAARTGVLVLTAFVAGVVFHASIATAHASDYRKLDIFARVLSYVENNYVEEVDEKALIYGAIKGMLGTLDPHTLFMPPDEYSEMKTDTSGEFGGLGLEVTVTDDRLQVVSPIDDTPAARAGILAGDRILEIDGTSTKGMTVPEAVRKMRGPAGSRVKLTIFRGGFSEPRAFVLLRDRVRVVSVDSRLYPGGYGYVRIKSFQDRTDQYLGRALDDLRKQNGGKELAGLVLDLRNNPGGLLDEAVRVSDRFIEDGVIVSTEGRNRAHVEVERAHKAGTEAPYPMIVLVNGGSASASEIVGGALQDYGRAVIMGTTSFGKGSVQTVIDLEDGSGLKLTIARYYTPKHRSIQEKGIHPDVVVTENPPPPAEGTKLLREADLKGSLKGDGNKVASASPPDDYQLRTALDTLRTWEIFKASLPPQGKTAAAER